MASNPSIADDLPPFSERKIGDEEIQILQDKIAALHLARDALRKTFRSDDSPSSEVPIPGVPSAMIRRNPLQRRQDIHDRHAHIYPIIDQLEDTGKHLVEELIEGTAEGYVGMHNSHMTLGCVIPISRYYPQFVANVLRLTVGENGQKRFVKIIDKNTRMELEFGESFVYSSLELVAFKSRAQADAWLHERQQAPANDE